MKDAARLLFVCGLLLPDSSAAANHYVRADATGTGTGADWVDAYTQLPETLNRGDTYYIAGGVYPAYDFDTPTDGTSIIHIKKATEDNPDCSSVAGWEPSFGESVAEFPSVLRFSTSYWIFDGVTGSRDSGHGFKVFDSVSCQTINTRQIVQLYNGIDHVTVSHTEIEGCTGGIYDGGATLVPRIRGFYACVGGTFLHIKVSHCYIHNVTSACLRLAHVQESVFENNFFENRLGGYFEAGGGQIHGEPISANDCGTPSNNVVRWNITKRMNGTGLFVIKDSVQSHWYIYGNVFFNLDPDPNYSPSQGFVSNTSGDTNTNMYVFNNTVVDFWDHDVGVLWYNGLENELYNNLFYNAVGVGVSGSNHDYNAYGECTGTPSTANIQTDVTAELFADYSHDDFALASATDPGLDLTQESWWDETYCSTLDMDGNRRGADGVWDRGAYEFNSELIPNPPSPPTNLRIID